MSLTEENSGIPATMLVGPASVGNAAPYPYPVYGGGNNGNNGFGDNGWWIILLFILIAAMGGNWGGNNNGGGAFGGGQPIIVNDGGNGGSVQRGFDQAAVMSGINGLQSGISGLSTQLCGCCGDIQNSLCSGFAGVNATINSTAANAETAANARAMASMQQLYGLSTQFADCCCENRLASADLKYTIATENCADRAALSEGIRDVITNQTANTQRILDQLCQDKIDAKNDEIAQLRQQLNMADLRASQTAQNAFISQGFANEVDALYNRLNTCPVPTTPVYGRAPIFTCNTNGCGCGCNGNAGFVG
jgi:hypothetical protein